MKFLRLILRLALLGFFGTVWLLAGVYLYLSPSLPDVESLRDVKLQTPMSVYTAEGDLIGQFGEQKRSPMKFDQIPQTFVNALLAAEDDGFFQHGGIDIMGLMRAVSELVITGQKGSGGSTLTMQVARNYFLSRERTFIRKFNEILLAIEIERALEKSEIFELYFNRVFLGHRSYGFDAAAQVYYGKSIADLNLAQQVMLAGIPKAPSRNNPISGPEAGEARRNWILGRMLALGYIDQAERDNAVQSPVTAEHHGAQLSFQAHYAAEMARQEMLEMYGVAAYTEGFHVYTTISSDLQKVAQYTINDGLIAYDKRHGYRGPERKLPTGNLEPATDAVKYWLSALAETAVIADLKAAIVTAVEEEFVSILLSDGELATIAWENGINQAAPYQNENSKGSPPQTPAEVLNVGDMIRTVTDIEGNWQLAQVPAAQAALVALDPDDGAILSVVGGMGFEQSKFNRATQAERQPGSNFKPFIYSAALEAGYTAASIINDAPVVFQDSSLEGIWRPENDGGKFYGPTRLRWALTKSRNLVSIRLLQQMGIKPVIDYAQRFGFDTSRFAPDLSLALGTHSVTPLKLAGAYTALANGGYRVDPYLVQRVENLSGDVLFKANPLTVCRNCEADPSPTELSMEQILAQQDAGKPEINIAPRIMDARVNYIIDSILQDVITRGTATRALVLKRGDLAGKTGTTNGPKDAWFSGYNRDVVTTTWVGFDDYTPLGKREFGGTAALPIWINFMREALKNSPDVERPIPAGIVNVKIDPDTGLLASAQQRNAIFEHFRAERVPKPASDSKGSGNTNQEANEWINDIF
ncbi:MAG: penicillin-binding protein 1A [Halioglobus sp.]|jgi:penicillin-binding protein 1A